MLEMFSASSAQPIIQRKETIENALWYLKEALLPSSRTNLSLGILFCREFQAKFCSGSSSDGTTWGFYLFGSKRPYEELHCAPLERDGLEFDLRQYCAAIRYFDILVHHRMQENQPTRFRVDACLPEQWCKLLAQCASETDLSQKEALAQTLLETFRRELSTRVELQSLVFSEGLIH